MFRYTRPHILLHWLMALLIGYQLTLDGGIGGRFGAAMRAGTAPQFDTGSRIHLLIGLSILILVLPRLMIRLRADAPPVEPGPLGTASRVTHGLVYVLMVGMPLSGLIAWFGRNRDVAEIHSAAANVLIALVLLHIGAALYHQFIRRDGLMGRMAP